MATATQSDAEMAAQQDRTVRRYLATLERGRPDIDVEAAVVERALAGYAERHGISYAAWREIGVPNAVLRKAGITARTSP